MSNFVTYDDALELFGAVGQELSGRIEKFSTMPTYTDFSLGIIIQYVGTTTEDYINGYFYERGSSGWVQKNVQPGSGVAQVQSDWNQSNTSAVDYIKNKPTIPTALSDLSDDSSHRLVSDTEKTAWDNKSDFSGSYDDLTNKPTIPDAQIQSDWNQSSSSAVDYIKNKPETTSSVTSGSSALVTSGAVYTAIDNLPEPMVFKGTLGTGGTITSLPTAASSNEGFTYKVITAGTYASLVCKVGDVVVSNGTAWVLIPAGDTDSDSWRAIQVNGVNFLGNAISTGYINIAEPTSGSSGLRLSASGNTLTISSLLPSVITTETDGSNSSKIGYCSYYKITNKSYVLVNLRTSNTAQSALTLTVNDKSTCPIYIDGEVSSATNYTLSAGTYLVYYESGKYYFRTDGKITAGGDVVDTAGNTVNNNVSMTTVSGNASYPVLLTSTNGTTERTEGAGITSELYYNPSTTRFHVPKITDLTEIGYKDSSGNAHSVSYPEFSDSLPSAYCDTIGTTADKVAQCTAFKGKSGGEYLHILMRNANTVESALTLQIGAVGVKPIYINGVASSATNYTLPAGSYIIRYDGTNYYFRTDDKLPANIEGDAGTVNGKTVGTNVPASAVFTDQHVTQTDTSNDYNYRVLLSGTADDVARREEAHKSGNLKFNPSTGNLQATQLNGTNISDIIKFHVGTYSGSVNSQGNLSLGSPYDTVTLLGATVDNALTYVCVGKNTSGKNMLAFRNIQNNSALASGTSVSGYLFYSD